MGFCKENLAFLLFHYDENGTLVGDGIARSQNKRENYRHFSAAVCILRMLL